MSCRKCGGAVTVNYFAGGHSGMCGNCQREAEEKQRDPNQSYRKGVVVGEKITFSYVNYTWDGEKWVK